MLLFFAQTLALCSVCLWAILRGAAPEKCIAGILIGMLVVDQAYHLATHRVVIYVSIDFVHFAIDAAGAFGLVVVALSANRVYPLWMASAQLISVLSHFARTESAGMAQGAYAILMRMPFYFLITILAVGVVAHVRRTKLFGTYPSWRRS